MNPIEEAQGYRKMRDLGYSIAEIAERVGCHTSSVNVKLGMLSLPDEVQKLFAQHRLPVSSQVTAALLSLPEDRRVSTAISLANKGATIKTILSICKRLANAASGADRKIEAGKNPMTVVASRFGNVLSTVGNWNMVQQARVVVSGDLLQAAEATCKNCVLYSDASEKVCRDCPAVDLLRRLAVKHE